MTSMLSQVDTGAIDVVSERATVGFLMQCYTSRTGVPAGKHAVLRQLLKGATQTSFTNTNQGHNRRKLSDVCPRTRNVGHNVNVGRFNRMQTISKNCKNMCLRRLHPPCKIPCISPSAATAPQSNPARATLSPTVP